MRGTFIYHSIIKTIRGKVIFYEDSDRLLFLNILRRFIDKHSVTLMEFVLMDNHIHLLHTANSIEHVALFVGELQQNFSYWYNRFRNSKDKLFIKPKIVPKKTDESIIKCALYILQNPMVACRGEYPHPGDYRWSSYRYHYNYFQESTSKYLVKKPQDVLRANNCFFVINNSKSVMKNLCPMLKENFTWPDVSLKDILDVNTNFIDGRYSSKEFKTIVQAFVISEREEYNSESELRRKSYINKHKPAYDKISAKLVPLLEGKNYNDLGREEQDAIIKELLKDRKVTITQIVMLLDEDRGHVQKILSSVRSNKFAK